MSFLALLLTPTAYSFLTAPFADRQRISCQRPTVAELIDLIIWTLNFADGRARPEITIYEYNIVCESPGLIRGTLGSFSAVIFYQCDGFAVCPNTPNDGIRRQTNYTHQFQSVCTNEGYRRGYLFSPLRVDSPRATLTTPLNDRCSVCSEPSVIPSDSVTFCFGKHCTYQLYTGGGEGDLGSKLMIGIHNSVKHQWKC